MRTDPQPVCPATQNHPPREALRADRLRIPARQVEHDDAGHVLRSPFVPGRRGLEHQLDAVVVVGVLDAVLAETQRPKPIEVLAAEEEDARPLRPQEPFVAVRSKKIDRRLANVEGHHTEGLDRVDQ